MQTWNESIFYHFEVWLGELRTDAALLEKWLANQYRIAAIWHPPLEQKLPDWMSFSEQRLLAEGQHESTNWRAVHQLIQRDGDLAACRAVMKTHEAFIAHLLDKQLCELIVPDTALDFNREELDQRLRDGELVLEQVSLHPLPQLGRLPVLVRVYDSPLRSDDPLQKQLLNTTKLVWSGKVQGWPLPEI